MAAAVTAAAPCGDGCWAACVFWRGLHHGGWWAHAGGGTGGSAMAASWVGLPAARSAVCGSSAVCRSWLVAAPRRGRLLLHTWSSRRCYEAAQLAAAAAAPAHACHRAVLVGFGAGTAATSRGSQACPGAHWRTCQQQGCWSAATGCAHAQQLPVHRTQRNSPAYRGRTRQIYGTSTRA